MWKVLDKRIYRDLKQNFFRYAALFSLIVLGMYLVVSMAASADTIITGILSAAKENNLEDGEFHLFVPLTKQQKEQLEVKGVALEETFYQDVRMEDASVIRVFQNRESINVVSLDEGRLAAKDREAVVEKRYAIEHSLKMGDTIKLGGENFFIVGIGSVPDYDAPLMNLTDSSVDSKRFGLVFVTKKEYQSLKDVVDFLHSEEYVYSYRRNPDITDDMLKDWIDEMQIAPDQVPDKGFQAYWRGLTKPVDTIQEAINDLMDATNTLQRALFDLSRNQSSLVEGSQLIFEDYISEANKKLSSYGYKTELTSENFEKVLADDKEHAKQPMQAMAFDMLLTKLKDLKAFQEGVSSYTDGVQKSGEGAASLYEGTKKLKSEIDRYLVVDSGEKIANLTQFIKAQDNPRIKASVADQRINRMAALLAGVLVLILFTYVLSVFIIHGIERESVTIGALYALGVRPKDLLLYYLKLPLFVSFLGGMIGTMLGFSRYGVLFQMGDCYDYFSVPLISVKYPIYLLVYGTLLPPLIALLVNYFVIRNRLLKPAMALLRNEGSQERTVSFSLNGVPFLARFQVRQFLREMRASVVVLLGMFISLLVFMMGADCYVMMHHMQDENQRDTKFSYLYLYKYPEIQKPAQGEAAFLKSLSKDRFGYSLELTLLGISSDNPYFGAAVNKGKNSVVISSAAAQKFGLKLGERLILTDKEEEIDYVFTVDGITQYSSGLFLFMDIDRMRDLFLKSDNYYNAVFSSQDLNIDASRLYGISTRESIIKSSDVFFQKMTPFVGMLLSVSVLMFCVVLYLMMKMMMDRSYYGISLLKVFGFKEKEVRGMYLSSNVYVVAIGAAILIFLSKKSMDLLYPLLVANVSCGMNLSFAVWQYGAIYAGILFCFGIIYMVLTHQLKQIHPAEVLKNRE